MFYIVRYWMAGRAQEQTFDTLESARDCLRHMEDHAELFVWLDGREWFMDSVN